MTGQDGQNNANASGAASLTLTGGAAIVAPVSTFPNGIPANALVVLPLAKPTDELIALLNKGPAAVTQDQMWALLGFNGPAVQVQDDQGRPIAIGLEDLLAGLEKHWQDQSEDLNRGRIYAQELLKYQRYEKAEGVLAKIVSKGGLVGDDWLALGVTQLQLEKLDKAESTLKGAQNIMKTNPYPSLHLAKVLKAKGDGEGEKAATLKAIEIQPQAVDAWGYLFHIINEKDGEAAAIAAVEELAAKPANQPTAAPYIAIQGFFANSDETREKAVLWAKRAVERNPNDPLALLCLSALYGQSNELNKVIDLLQPHEAKMTRDVRLAHNYFEALFQSRQLEKVTRLLNALAGSSDKDVKQFAIERSRAVAQYLQQQQQQLAGAGAQQQRKVLSREGKEGPLADVIIIGSGPNGLTAGAHLARAGLKVLVLEASTHLGGACRTAELTLPGFLHDVGAGFFPFGTVSPAFKALDLEGAGVRWKYGSMDSAHPALDGTCPTIGRNLERTMKSFGRDGDAWRPIAKWHQQSRDDMLPALLGPLPPAPGAALDFGFDNALTLASAAIHSGRSFSESRFSQAATRRVVPALGLHADVGPDDPLGAAIGLVLAMLASSSGFCVPEGGAGAITRALARRIEEAGGEIRLGTRVEKILVRGGRAVGVLAGGAEIEASRAIVADTGAPALYLKLLDPEHVPARVHRAMKSFKQGWGTFKLDWALSGAVPWTHPLAAEAAVVHTGESVDDLARFTNEVRDGKLPSQPYLVIGQQSLCDATRAPAGQHTLYAYTHVPSYLSGGWTADVKQRFADEIEARIESLAPGFRARILGRSILAPNDLESMNENLVGGDLGGGSSAITSQFIFRPVFPFFRHRTPVSGLYLGSSYTHPGTGVHGACGYNAAQRVLGDL